MELVKIPRYLVTGKDKIQFNTSNVMTVAPLFLDSKGMIMVHSDFYMGLPQALRDNYAKVLYPAVTFPDHHEGETNEIFKNFLEDYHNTFDYQLIHNEIYMGSAIILPIPNALKTEIYEIANIRIQSDRPLKNFMEPSIMKLTSEIEQKMNEFPKQKEWFVRLSGSSTKHDGEPLRPVRNALEVMEMITGSRKIAIYEWSTQTKPTYLILKPWNYIIRKENEFRVFVWNRQVTGAAQQHWDYLLNHSDKYMDTVNCALSKFVYPPSFPSTCVLDLIVMEDGTIRIIEINPWISSGSSLFEHERDQAILKGHAKPQLRVLVSDDTPHDLPRICTASGLNDNTL